MRIPITHGYKWRPPRWPYGEPAPAAVVQPTTLAHTAVLPPIPLPPSPAAHPVG